MKLQGNIPQPCSESWNKMKIGVDSRFCDHCSKNVIDFTNKSRQEILEYLLVNYNKKVCGRVLTSQLDFNFSDYIVTISSLSKKHNNTNLSFYLLAAGTMILAGCQQPADNRVTTKAETVQTELTNSEEDSIATHKACVKEQIAADPIIITEETAGMIELPVVPDSVSFLETVYVKSTHRVVSTVGVISIPATNKTKDNVFQYPDKMPEFKGGIDSLNRFINQQLNYPKWERKKKIEGKVIARFIIDEKGKIKAPEITRSVPGSKNFNKEVIRILKKMPAWNPGMNEGINVKTEFHLPFTFKLD